MKAEEVLDKFWPKEFGESITYEEVIKAMKFFSNEKIKIARQRIRNSNALWDLIEEI